MTAAAPMIGGWDAYGTARTDDLARDLGKPLRDGDAYAYERVVRRHGVPALTRVGAAVRGLSDLSVEAVGQGAWMEVAMDRLTAPSVHAAWIRLAAVMATDEGSVMPLVGWVLEGCTRGREEGVLGLDMTARAELLVRPAALLESTDTPVRAAMVMGPVLNGMAAGQPAPVALMMHEAALAFGWVMCDPRIVDAIPEVARLGRDLLGRSDAMDALMEQVRSDRWPRYPELVDAAYDEGRHIWLLPGRDDGFTRPR